MRDDRERLLDMLGAIGKIEQEVVWGLASLNEITVKTKLGSSY